MKCISCKRDCNAVFRTNPMGQADAGWMCNPCIVKYHDASLIDSEVQELADTLTEALSNKTPPTLP